MKRPDAELVERMIVDAMQRDDWCELDRLALLLDELSSAKQPPSPLVAAHWYASLGLNVFPIQPGQKVPYAGTRGVLDATDDGEQIERWWSARPDSNVGIATGHVVDVVDIDGLRGNVSLLAAGELLEQLRESAVGFASTPRPGGRHFYVRTSGRHGNAAALAEGIDYRGKGGYVLAPPSRTAQGLYVWTRALDVGRQVTA